MLLGDKLEGVAVDTVPVGVGGEAEGAAAGIARTAATEKTAGIERHLIARDGDILEGALHDDVIVGIEGGHGELRQHIFLGMGQGVYLVDAVGAYGTYLRLLGVHAAVAGLGAEGRGASEVVELELSNFRWHALVGQHQAEHGHGARQREVVRLQGVGHHQGAVIKKGVGHLVVGERHLFRRGYRGRAVAVVRDDHQAVRARGQAQRHRAIAGVALLLRHGLHLRTLSVEDGDVQARAEVGDVGSRAGKCLLLVLRKMQNDIGL